MCGGGDFSGGSNEQQEGAAPIHAGVPPGPIPCIRMARMSTHFQGDLSFSTYPIPESSLYGRDPPPIILCSLGSHSPRLAFLSFSPFPPGLLFLVLQQPNHEVSATLGDCASVVQGLR